ncbi:MAG: peptide ABC transporter substrate-binding protein [Verrucomicrobia bacterium]|nr:peptide ABC transporter substrate-binding protein [Verrucomicrobiota bacterium]
MWKEIKRAFILFVLVLSTSCQKGQDKTVSSLKIDFQEGDLPSLHPHSLMIYLRGIGVAKTLYECLTRIDSDGIVQLAGAKSVDVSPDQLRYTFKLRDNRWSDGSPVTAFQYEKAWKEALSPTSSCSRADLLYMIKNAKEAKQGTVSLDTVGVKATDAHTLIVELAYPSPYFLELAAQPICAPMIDPSLKEQMVFNGPFIVDEWKHNDVLRLKPNSMYWDKEHIELEQIEIYMIQDVMTAYSMFEKKQLDWIGVPFAPLSTELIGQLKKDGSLKSHPVDRAFWVFLNTQMTSLSSPAIRKALSLALDRKAITEHILIGGHPLEKPLPKALLPLDASSHLKMDLAEAQLSFADGLKEMGLTKETFPAIVITYSQQANRKQVAEYLQQAWSQAFGIPVKLEAQEWNVLRTNLEKGQFEISGCYEAAFYKDPMELLEKMVTVNTNNFSKWTTQQFSEKVLLAKQESNPQKRMQLLSEAEHILMEQTPFIPICSDELLFAHRKGLTGYAFDYVGAVDFSRASFSN